MDKAEKAQTVARLEREAVEVRLTHTALAQRAGLDFSTWFRIRKNPEQLTIASLDKLETAIRTKRAEMTPA